MSILVKGTLCAEMQCPSCGVNYALPEILYETAYREGGCWSCPNGHRRGWDKAHDDREENKVRQERDRLKQETARLEEAVASRDRELEAERRKAARHAKRASAGTCPCCTRTFSNMARHMATKHPDYNVVPLKAVKA